MISRSALGRLHPSFMGGEYLPDRRETEVEIARINIDSTTSDVTSVYAKAGKDRVLYRVVDEYGGDTLTVKPTRSSKRRSGRGLMGGGRRGRRTLSTENGWSDRRNSLVQLQTVRD
jgi:hypothetical protein